MAAFRCDHDYHVHTTLSTCCVDPGMTAEGIADYAASAGYASLCYTDHLWDEAFPGVSEWYAPQTIAHVRSRLPLPSRPPLRLCLGCETEYMGGERLALLPEHFDLFDFVVIPVTHMHSIGYVRPEGITTAAQMAELFVQRLEELAALPLPWRKVGLAHLTDPLLFQEGNVADVMALLDEARFLLVMERYAEGGAGVELNGAAFPAWEERPDDWLRPYRLAKRAGCRFYCGSDAHRCEHLSKVRTVLEPVAQALALTEADRYTIPERA